jgi:choline dehydrogenase-like flavoprotein
MFPFLARSPVDWAFLTEPQNNSFINIENQQVPWQRGKVMGGSSAINGIILKIYFEY